VESKFPLQVYENLSPELDRLSTAYARQAFVRLFGERAEAAGWRSACGPADPWPRLTVDSHHS